VVEEALVVAAVEEVPEAVEMAVVEVAEAVEEEDLRVAAAEEEVEEADEVVAEVE
jgi:uncharacterized protein (UPF0212 family)